MPAKPPISVRPCSHKVQSGAPYQEIDNIYGTFRFFLSLFWTSHAFSSSASCAAMCACELLRHRAAGERALHLCSKRIYKAANHCKVWLRMPVGMGMSRSGTCIYMYVCVDLRSSRTRRSYVCLPSGYTALKTVASMDTAATKTAVRPREKYI